MTNNSIFVKNENVLILEKNFNISIINEKKLLNKFTSQTLEIKFDKTISRDLILLKSLWKKIEHETKKISTYLDLFKKSKSGKINILSKRASHRITLEEIYYSKKTSPK